MRKKTLILLAWLMLGVGANAQLLTGAACTDEYLPQLQGKRVGLVVNHTSLVGAAHLVDTLRAAGVNISIVFAPEHGFRGGADAGAAISDSTDARTGILIRSLYGKNKKPSPADLQRIDVMVFDIQDVGTRFYTYISTLFYVSEACAEARKPLIVLDRPNPNGHYVDGPVLETPYKSFVGMAPVPLVHGCTVGELAQMFKGEKWINAADSLPLSIVPCAFYTHDTHYAPPVRPSPNLPDVRSILMYPGLCLFEGTKVSVGRGTDRPFQRIGYPDFPAGKTAFTPSSTPGAQNPPYNGQACEGFDLTETTLDSLYAMKKIDLSWLLFFFEKSPRKDDFFVKTGFFNLLAGNRTLRVQVEQGMKESEIRASWQPGLQQYKAMRSRYLLYPES